jgi:hypothetical protein
MSAPSPRPDPEKQARLLAELRRDQALRQQSYRERALRLLPHVCARCGREFADKRLRELTVHHRDHDYHHNPPDGSNWELLCLYCHDHEHEKFRLKGFHQATAAPPQPPGTFQPFAGLDGILKPQDAKGEPKPAASESAPD